MTPLEAAEDGREESNVDRGTRLEDGEHARDELRRWRRCMARESWPGFHTFARSLHEFEYQIRSLLSKRGTYSSAHEAEQYLLTGPKPEQHICQASHYHACSMKRVPSRVDMELTPSRQHLDDLHDEDLGVGRTFGDHLQDRRRVHSD